MRWGAVRFIAVMLALAVLSREAVAEMAAFGAARHLVLSGSIFGQYYHGAGSGGTGAATIAVAPNLHWFGIGHGVRLDTSRWLQSNPRRKGISVAAASCLDCIERYVERTIDLQHHALGCGRLLSFHLPAV